MAHPLVPARSRLSRQSAADVGIDLVGANTTFFFPDMPVRYAVRVTDRRTARCAAAGSGRRWQ